MKILHVTQNYFPSIGGTQYLIKNLSEELYKTYEDEVDVFTTNSLYSPNSNNFVRINKDQELINGINVRRFSFMRSHRVIVKSLNKLFRYSKAFSSFCRNLQFGPISLNLFYNIVRTDADVIAVSSLHYLFADYPYWRKFISNPKPFVLHGAPHLESADISIAHKKRIKEADIYIANTAYEKEYLGSMGLNKEKIVVIGIGTSILNETDFSFSNKDLRHRYNLSEDDTIITYLGRQETFKGLPLLMESYNKIQLSNKRTKLIIAGAKGNYSNQIKEIAKHKSNILVFDNITEKQKAEILRLTDALILPSKEESFGIVFIEAWSFSKPVIGANIPAIASLIDNGKNGLLFEKDNVESLTDKIKMLIKNKALRQELGSNGHKKFRENYTWDIVAAKYRNAYLLAIEKFNNRSGIKHN